MNSVKDELKKYHEVWYLQLTERNLPFLHDLKRMSPEQIREQIKIEPSPDPFLVDWRIFVGNEHTLPVKERPIQQLLAIHDIAQRITRHLFPQWVMDRFKEALDQYVRSEWLSSISLCGDVVEFIVNDFWQAYIEKIPSERRKTPSDGVLTNLKTLSDSGVFGTGDYERLAQVRKTRDDHIHNYPRNVFHLGKDYPEVLKKSSLESLSRLAEFFEQSNMENNYSQYLGWAYKEFFQVTKK